MKVLVVASGNANYVSPFILDQAIALEEKGTRITFYLVKGRGIIGYFKNYQKLINEINRTKPDLIHAHYGLSGLLCVLQRNIPVIVTFHGSDINDSRVRIFSRIADLLSSKSIFVSQELAKKLNKRNPIVIPCGVDLEVFYPIDKVKAKKQMDFSLSKRYILFSSSFSNTVKNYPLAKEAISKLSQKNIELIELKGFKREEVAYLMNAVDLVLLTSYSEGSPQFIKEAMACNTSVVSVDVGDVSKIISKTDGCYLANYDSIDLASKIEKALIFNQKTKGRNQINEFDNKLISTKIIELYNTIINN